MNFVGNSFFVYLAITLAVILTDFQVSGQFSNATLHKNCKKVRPTNKLSQEWGMRLFAGAHFYIPFSSTSAIHHISQVVAGQDPKVAGNKDDISRLCALVRIRGFKLQIDGHDGKYLVQDCNNIKKGMNDCKVSESQSENPKNQKNGDQIVIIVWTDNKTTMAIVRCTADGRYNDWYTFSMKTSLDPKMQAEILVAIGKLGISNKTEEAVSPGYQGCQLFTAEELADDD